MVANLDQTLRFDYFEVEVVEIVDIIDCLSNRMLLLLLLSGIILSWQAAFYVLESFPVLVERELLRTVYGIYPHSLCVIVLLPMAVDNRSKVSSTG